MGQMLFEIVEGKLRCRLPRRMDGSLRVADGKTLLTVEQASMHSGRSKANLEAEYRATFDGLLEPLKRGREMMFCVDESGNMMPVGEQYEFRKGERCINLLEAANLACKSATDMAWHWLDAFRDEISEKDLLEIEENAAIDGADVSISMMRMRCQIQAMSNQLLEVLNALPQQVFKKNASRSA